VKYCYLSKNLHFFYLTTTKTTPAKVLLRNLKGKKKNLQEKILFFVKLFSITRTRTEVILQGTRNKTVIPDALGAIWEEYEFKCKPGLTKRRPCLISPYHYRLDWLMWFSAFMVSLIYQSICSKFPFPFGKSPVSIYGNQHIRPKFPCKIALFLCVFWKQGHFFSENLQMTLGMRLNEFTF